MHFNTTIRTLLLEKLKENVFPNLHHLDIEEPRMVMEPISGDCDDCDQETSRIDYAEVATLGNKMLLDIKHAKTTPLIKAETEIAPIERSQSVREQKGIHLTEITDDELNTFTTILKDKLKLSPFLREQFDLISSLPPPSLEAIEARALKLPKPKRQKLTNKTLIFDLDETLIYSMSDDAMVRTKVYPKANVKRTSYIASKTGKSIEMNVVIRPYAIEMLKQLSAYYEIIVFTAAVKNYGDAIIDLLDPKEEYIDYRLYRDNCIKVNNFFIKDLRILNRDLSSVIIVDNSLISFSNQLENGILIPSFTGSKPDSELAGVWIFLRQATNAEDIRGSIASKYNLKLFYQLHKKIKGQR